MWLHFQKSPGDYASKLIEKADLKGKRVGGIYISDKHSNYFINDGSGTYKDFLLLLQRVKMKFTLSLTYYLEEEVILK